MEQDFQPILVAVLDSRPLTQPALQVTISILRTSFPWCQYRRKNLNCQAYHGLNLFQYHHQQEETGTSSRP